MTQKTEITSSSRCSIVILCITVFFIVSVVISGICVKFLIEEGTSRIILVALILILFVFGTVAVIILEIRRRTALKKKKKQQNLAARGRVAVNHTFDPSAPPLSGRSSWAYSKSYSTRSTMQPQANES